MIRQAATSTDVRKQKIMNILNEIKYNEADTVKGFGLRVDSQFAQIPARILTPPTLEYQNKKFIQPNRGEWRAEQAQFITPQQNVNWGVLVLDNRTQDSAVRGMCGLVCIDKRL